MKKQITKIKESYALYIIKNLIFCIIAAAIISLFLFVFVAGIYILIMYLFNL